MVAGRRTRAWAGMLLCLVLLAGCNTDDDASDDMTTGRQTQFEISGDVSAVDIEDIDVDPGISTGPDGIDVDPSASVRVQLTVNVESINDQAAELCELQPGGDAILLVTEDTDIDFDRPLDELDTLNDESITATGTAEERLVESDATPNASDPDGTCVLRAERLALREEATTTPAATPTAGPSPGITPTP
jgi:hypothetical protein